MTKASLKDTNSTRISEESNSPVENSVFKYGLYLLFVLLLIFLSITKISGEDDFFWHLASGKYIVENKTVPSTDVFGYVTYGQEWIPFEWGWDVITFLIFSLSGYVGIYTFKVIIILLTFFIYSRILSKLKLSDSLKIIFLLILCWGMLFRFSIRPHLISYLFYVLILYVIASYKYFDRKNYQILFYLPVIFLFWANLHLGAVTGIFMFSLFVVSEIIIYLFPKNLSTPEIPPLNKTELLRLLSVYIISLAVLLVNPNHINTYIYAFSLTKSKLIYDLGEFKSPFDSNYNSSLAMITYKILLGSGIIALYYSFMKKDLYAFLMVIFFALYSFKAARFTTDYNIAASVFIFTGIIYLLGKIESIKFRKFINANYGLKLVLILIMLFQIFSIPNDRLFNSFFHYYRKWGIGIDRNFFSQEMFDFAKNIKLNETGNHPFNQYTCGGLFIWSFPQNKNFIDSRFINDEIYSEYSNIHYMRTGFIDKLKKYDIDYFMYVVPSMLDNPRSLSSIVIAFLSQKNDEWKLIYWDDVSFIFVKNVPKFESIISRYEYKYVTPYNYIFQKKLIDKAYMENKATVVNEIKRKLAEEPNGDIINTFASVYKIK